MKGRWTPDQYLAGVRHIADLEREVADIDAVLDTLADQTDRYERAKATAIRSLASYREAIYGEGT